MGCGPTAPGATLEWKRSTTSESYVCLLHCCTKWSALPHRTLVGAFWSAAVHTVGLSDEMLGGVRHCSACSCSANQSVLVCHGWGAGGICTG